MPLRRIGRVLAATLTILGMFSAVAVAVMVMSPLHSTVVTAEWITNGVQSFLVLLFQ